MATPIPAKAVLEFTPRPRTLPGIARQVVGFFLIAPFERWSLAWVALTDYARSGIRRYLQTLRSMVDNHIAEKALRISQPTLVVWGTRDYIVPYAFVTSLAASLPQGRFAAIPGAAHGINYSHPEAFTDALLPFLLAPQERAPTEDLSFKFDID
ncbi:alpha/beta hydrolase [Methylorubrum populi]|uniref:alpha/beta fold hydrolase n=1 Tax=Methylorubrum populi TaxID=223967 RepID=UPI0031F774DE